MFKFLKSKKGFTLVELMIVVVIMAILVAVAVPIYSAVTRNARIKTCAGNRREIVSQINNYLMGSIDGKTHNSAAGATILSDGDNGYLTAVSGDFTAEKFKGLFQTLPYCPSGDATGGTKGAANETDTATASKTNYGTYTITVTAVTAGDDQDATARISVTCSGAGDDEAHA